MSESRAARALIRAREIDENFIGTPDLTTVIELLDAAERRNESALKRQQGEHRAEMVALEARLLRQTPPPVSPPGRVPVPPKVPVLARKESSMEGALTYDEAFAAVGGDAAVLAEGSISEKVFAAVGDAELDAELALLLPRDYADRRSFSTRLVNQPYVTNFEEIYERAKAVHESFSLRIEEIGVKTNARVIVPPVKSMQRAKMKAAFKYSDDSAGIAFYRLTDLVRATLIFNDVAAMYSGLEKVVFDLIGTDNVREYNDRYKTPLAGGYRDLQLTVEHRGHLAELQLNTAPMLRAKETKGHRDFEIVRELRSAVFDGDLDRVVTAFDWGRDNQGAVETATLERVLRSEDAKTLLHDAAERGRADIVHVFIDAGADVDAKDDDWNTPLHKAAAGGHERAVWALLNCGHPDLDATNKLGETALVVGYVMLHRRPPEAAVRCVATLSQVAGPQRIKQARQALPTALKRRLQNSRLLVDLALDGNTRAVRDELCKYADPDSKRDALSALEAAVNNGHTETVEVLLDFKASPCNPGLLTKSIEQTLFEVARQLLGAGARLNPADFERLLREAVTKKWVKTVEMLHDYTHVDPTYLDLVEPIFVSTLERNDREEVARALYDLCKAKLDIAKYGATFAEACRAVLGDEHAKEAVIETATLTASSGNDDSGTSWAVLGEDIEEPRKAIPTFVDAEEEEVPCVVLEIGSYQSRCGFAGDDAPKLVRMTPFGIFDKGMPCNLELLEQAWSAAFYSVGVNSCDHPVLLTEPMHLPKATRERITQLMFETFNVPAFYMNSAGGLALYASGRTTGMVLDSGHSFSTSCPYYEGYALPHAIERTSVGGAAVTAYLATLLAEENSVETPPPNLAARIKEGGLCYVPQRTLEEEQDDPLRQPQPPVDGVTIGTAHFKCAELLFQPSLSPAASSSGESVHNATYSSIMKCDVDIRKDMFNNIILSGGTTLITGFAERLNTELTKLAPSTMQIKVIALPERLYSTWVGGSILASLSTFQSMWVTKEEYDETGPSIVHRKCMS